MFRNAKVHPQQQPRFMKVQLNQAPPPLPMNQPLPVPMQEKQNKRPLTLMAPQNDREKTRKYQKT